MENSFKRFLSMVLVVLMVFGTLPTNAFAMGNRVVYFEGEDLTSEGGEKTSYVAKVGETGYTDIQEAIKAAAPAGTVELLSDVTVDKWIMFAETMNISSGQIITLNINGLTINGNGHTLTVKSVESASNGNYLFYDAQNLNINDLTIDVTGNGIGLQSGTLKNVVIKSTGIGVAPGTGAIKIEGCTFETGAHAIYSEADRDNLVVDGCTFKTAEGKYAIYLRGKTTFTNNKVVSGKVNVVSGSPVVTGNDFGTERFKVYNAATAEISGNTINNLEFSDTTSEVGSKFSGNTLSESAQTAMDAAGVVEKELPNAEVIDLGKITVDEYSIYNGSLTEGGEPIDLQIAMEFIAKDTPEEAAANAYGNYTTDFYITFNKSFTANDCYLAGNYGTFGWIMIPIDGMEIEANKVYPVITSVGFDFKYTDICTSVQDFKCGIYIAPEILEANSDLEVKLELGLSKTLEAAQAADFVVVGEPYVYTAEELAGYVAQIGDKKYTSLQEALNAAAAGTGNVTVEILTDVDLTGTTWTPVTVSASGYPVVTVNGNKKTITGLTDMLFASTWAGKSGLIINDLTIADSAIVNDKDDTKGTVGVGAFIGYPQASATITLKNCHLVDSSVEGGHWTGGLIGMAGGYNGDDGPVFMNLTITGCSVTGSTITGKGSAGGIIGHGSCAAWTNVVIENTTVSGNTITSTGSSTNKAGSVMGTIGAAGQPTTANGETKTGGASVSATVSGNTVKSADKTITTIYGRQGTETGLLVVAGGSYDSYPIEEGVAYAAPAEGYKIAQNTDGTYGVVAMNYVAQIGDVKYDDLHKAMVAAKSGETVLLIADVDLAGVEWEPVSFDGSFDGQYHVISNLTINKPGVSNTGFIKSLNGTFKNVTFTNPTVTGGENTGVVAGRAGGAAALAENITINGTIKVETTHSGYARVAAIVGGWAYGNYKNITVDGGDKAVSYIKHTGGGDGRYVAGIVGHADVVDSYVNCTVKNITISGGWLCGGIAGPGPSDGIATGCVVENVNIGAHCSGGMFGWYYGSGTIENSAVKNVTFTAGSTNNGAIGGYSANPDAKLTNVTIENVKNANGAPLLGDVASVNGVYYETLEAALEAAKGNENIVVDLVANATLDITAWQTLAIGGDTTKTITINGNGKTLTFNQLNSDWNHVATNNNAKLILNNMKITNSGYNNGPWNRHDINFACDVELNNVTSDKALAFKAGAVLNKVTISDANTSDTYAIWIQPNGQTVTITDSTIDMLGCSDGRGIKIDNQYNEAQEQKVTLAVSDTSFKTEEKAAILVKSAVGADITLKNIDISGVAADTTNAVWNDSDAGANYGKVNVTGGTLAQEDAAEFAAVVKADGAIVGYYKTLEAALAAAQASETIELLVPIVIAAGEEVVLDLKGATVVGVPTEAKSYAVITNNGKLTIKNGTIVCDHKLAGSTGYAVNTITNCGELIIENATIENKSTAQYQIGYAIDNNSTSYNAIVTINSGKVVASGSNYYDGIRQFCNSLTAENKVVVNGGEVSSLWMQNPSDGAEKNTKDVKGSFEINGGKVGVISLEPSTEFKAAITGGNIGSVSAFQTAEGRDLSGFISGGTFTNKPDDAYAAEGYEFVQNDNGTYDVEVDPAYGKVAKIGATYYATIAEALAAAQAGDTVVILAGNYTTDIAVNNGITVAGETDAEGNNLVNITGRVSASTGATVENLNVHNEKTGDYDCALSVNGKDIVIDGCKLTGYNAMRYCYASGNITIKNSTINGSNFAVHFDGSAGGNIAIENCDITGWCSYAGTVNSVSYKNTKLDQGNYSGHRYYNKNISFTDCDFAEGLLIDLRASGTTVAITDENMTDAEAKALFKDPYYVAKGNITLNGNPVVYAVSANSKYYDTLQEAIDDLPADSATYYAYLRSDNVLAAPVVIPADKKLAINLNGFDITYTSAVMGEAMITNNGELTIEGEGEVVYTYTGEADSSYGKGNYTIANNGTLTVESGTIKNATASMKHAYYTIQNGGNATFTLKDGMIVNETSYAIRQFASGSNTNTVNINGGEVKGTRAVWMQAAGSNTDHAPAMVLNVTGGKLTATGETGYKLAVYSYNYGNSPKNIEVNVSGGTIDGDIALTGGANKTAAEKVTITGGTLTDVYSYAADEVAAPAIKITGGTFASNYAEIYALDDGYIFTLNEDGTYDVVVDPAYGKVAKIGETYYETFAEALAAIEEGSTLELLDDVTIDSKINVTADLTINGNGHTLTYTGSDRAIDVPNTANGADLTVKNLTIEFTSGYSQRGINYNTNGTLVLDNVTVNGGRSAVTYAVNLPSSSTGAKVEINNSNITGLIALNVWGANTTVTATNTAFTSVDKATHENYAAVKLNSNGTDAAEGAVITITGGSITALDENDDPSSAATNSTLTGVINISNTTVVTGKVEENVAVVLYNGANEFYGCSTLQDAVDKAANDSKATVKLIKNIELTETIKVTGKVVVDLNGKKLTGPDDGKSNWYAFIVDGGNLTLKDSVETGELWAKCYGVETKSGSFTLDGAKITATNNATLGSAIVNYGGEVVINSGTLAGNLASVYTGGYFSNASTTIKAGTLTGPVVMEDHAEKEYKEVVKSASNEYAIDESFGWVKEEGSELYVLTAGYYAVKNTTTNTLYTSVETALNAAKSGETVQLIADAAAASRALIVYSGVTLDLNGYALTADHAVAFSGAHIVDNSENRTSVLKVAKGNLILDINNAMMPVYNGVDGYIFTTFVYALSQDTKYVGEGFKINAIPAPGLNAVELFKDGAADNDVKIMIRLTWDTADGVRTQDFVFNENTIGNVYKSNKGTETGYGRMFTMTVTGIDSVSNLRANVVILSGTHAEVKNAKALQIK
ncbi:MAG: hypothetical protein E7332_00460 [Clostridiales bacterium]|nr:hypothetical protein [Clostridiales bacterium]